MSERSALVAVLGALDTAIAATEDASEREQLQARVAELIPAYGKPGAVGWFRRAFRDEGPPPTRGDAEAALSDALEALAGTRGVQRPEEQPSPRMLPHWLIAVGAVARALPRFRDPSEHPEAEQAARALMVPGLVASMPTDRSPNDDEFGNARDEALELLRWLSDPELLASISDYPTFRDSNRNVLHQQILSQPDPCAGELVVVENVRRPDVAVALRTSVCVTGVTLADCEQTFLDPSNWGDIDAWCAMEPDSNPDHGRTFLEFVDFDCAVPSPFGVAVWLEFSDLVVREDSRILSYTIANAHESEAAASGLLPNGAVTVDEGSIKVTLEEDGGGQHLLVETTKRVAFTNPSFDESTIGILACAVGWGEMAIDFISDLLTKAALAQVVPCMTNHGDTGVTTSAGTTATGYAAGATAAGVTAGDALDDATALMKQSIDDCAAAFKKMFETALGAGGAAATPGGGAEEAGGYTADTLAADVGAAFARSLQAWARVLTAATTIAARIATTQPRPAPGPGAGGGSGRSPGPPAGGGTKSKPEA